MQSGTLAKSVAALLLAASFPIQAAYAESVDVGALKEELKALQEQQEAARARIDQLEKRLELLDGQLDLGSYRIPDSTSATMRGRGVGQTQTGEQAATEGTPSGAQTAAADGEARKSPAPTDAVEAVTRSEQGYFNQRITIEPGLTYSHFSNAQLNLSGFLALDAIFLGLISIDQVSADVLTADLTARYGVQRLQADINIPYLFRRSNFRSGGAGGNASGLIEETVSSRGLGDVSAGLSYRLMKETARLPDVVINARVKAPTGRHPFGVELVEVEGSEGNLNIPERLSTGSGVWGASAGVSLLKTLDPMVVFGSFTYFHNFKSHFSDLDEAPNDQPGYARLGSAFQYGVGVAFALNDRSSLSTSFTQRFVRHARLLSDPTEANPDPQWRKVIGSQANVGILNLGATFSLTNRLTLLANLGVGTTDDAPDTVVSVRLPYRF
jgi:hypothetical protein